MAIDPESKINYFYSETPEVCLLLDSDFPRDYDMSEVVIIFTEDNRSLGEGPDRNYLARMTLRSARNLYKSLRAVMDTTKGEEQAGDDDE